MQSTSESDSPAPATAEPTCDNCGREKGKLEQLYQWGADGQHAVCMECYRRLSEAEAVANAPAAEQLAATVPAISYEPRPPQRRYAEAKGPVMICNNPNCGYRGPMIKRARGSLPLALFLLFLGGIPGIIYMIACSGTDVLCPACRIKVAFLN